MSDSFYPLQVEQVIQETDDAKRLVLSVPAQTAPHFTFQHGQYLTFRAKIDGEDVRRSYSICSAVDEPQLEVAVKKIPGGVFSTYVNEEVAAGLIPNTV